jgi:lipopolysaccharide/colanic/teichoic acid biosynthesis glycosyltransferase
MQPHRRPQANLDQADMALLGALGGNPATTPEPPRASGMFERAPVIEPPPSPGVVVPPAPAPQLPTAHVAPTPLLPDYPDHAAFVPAERLDLLTRALNMALAAIALLVLAPLCVVVALAVKLTSKGPVFYTQTRVGIDRRWNRTHALNERRVEDLGGQPFTILKFRSMTVDAEANGQAVWATKHDARVTPVGRVLRKTRLDEIPQLINVLRGEMNIVGPRPERPSIVVRLRENIPEYTVRHRVKPGITGWAQINHAYDSCLEDVRIKVRYDIEYMRKQSVWFDLRIMTLTLPVMLFRKGAH